MVYLTVYPGLPVGALTDLYGGHNVVDTRAGRYGPKVISRYIQAEYLYMTYILIFFQSESKCSVKAKYNMSQLVLLKLAISDEQLQSQMNEKKYSLS